MIRREAARPNECREQSAIQSMHRSRSWRCLQRSLHKPRHRTSMPGSHARARPDLDAEDLAAGTPLSAAKLLRPKPRRKIKKPTHPTSPDRPGYAT
jgi:hypothetical protein